MTNRRGYVAYQLREAMKFDLIPAVFADMHNPDDSITGHVLCVGQKSCVIESVNAFAQFDGWFGVRLDCIIEVLIDDQYPKRLMILQQIDHYQRRGLPNDTYDWQQGDAVALMLAHALEMGRAVTCWTEHEAFVGFVEELDDLYVTMTLFDFMGEICAAHKIRLMDIEMVSILSEEELMYEKLNAHHEATKKGL